MILILEGGFFGIFGIEYSSEGGYFIIIEQYYKSVKLTKMLESLSDEVDSNAKTITYMTDSEFYHDGIDDYREKTVHYVKIPM